MQEKYGFVYIWFDRKHKRYYIGCHWGSIDDGYICSSSWMKQGYKHRPEDFKRRILETINTSRKDLIELEYKWLSKIKDHELGIKYYNLNNKIQQHWYTDENKRKTVGQKISASPERAKKISEALTGIKRSDETKEKVRLANVGKKHSEETKKKMSLKRNRDYSDPSFKEKMSIAATSRSEETKSKISDNSKRLQAEGKIGMKGRKHSEETKEKMRLSALKRTINSKKNSKEKINAF